MLACAAYIEIGRPPLWPHRGNGQLARGKRPVIFPQHAASQQTLVSGVLSEKFLYNMMCIHWE